MNKLASIVLKFLAVVCVTCFTHWLLVTIYSLICVPRGIWGPIKTFINLGSPVCQFINYLQFELAKHYITIWMVAGASLVTWAVSQLTLT